MRFIYILFLPYFFFSAPKASLKQVFSPGDSSANFQKNNVALINSATNTSNSSLRDSLAYFYIKPNPKRVNLFTDSLLRASLVNDRYLLTPAKSLKIKKYDYGFGEIIPKDPLWFLVSSITLLVFFGIIKIVFKKEVDLILKAFFDNRTLGQINKEDNVFVSWQFLFLYLIFSFTIGLFVYLIFYKTLGSGATAEFLIFLLISLFAFVFLGLKILLLKLLGFIFEVQNLIKDYTNIIYLTYFNLLFILLPVTFCLTLINLQEHYYVFWSFMILLAGILIFQYVRITINILLKYKLSKFYLILYLCILEVCPILIFAKTINISL